MFGHWDTPHMRRNAVRFFAETCAGLVLCFALKRASAPYVETLPDGIQRDAVALLPLLGVLMIAAAGLRAVRRVDEYGRRRLIEAFAAAGALTMVLTLAYAMLENAGWPRLSMTAVSFMLSGAWVVCALVDAWLRHR